VTDNIVCLKGYSGKGESRRIQLGCRFTIELKQTPFDQKDATILDNATGGIVDYKGSCVDCPKRTGNAKDE
jgi:hypothetical protein